MTLTGNLFVGSSSREIVSISVSLQEGLTLWARDALESHRRLRRSIMDGNGMQMTLPPMATGISCPETELPCGRYALPLSVQCPQRLPATIDFPHGRFAITYHLSVILTCDDPFDSTTTTKPIQLASCAGGFTLLPSTMPTEERSLMDHSVIHGCLSEGKSLDSMRELEKRLRKGARAVGLSGSYDASWKITPSL